MSGRRASMSDASSRSDGDAKDLHEKLHVLEAARAKEMRIHGELVQQLQNQLASYRLNDKELQLTVAKLRADKCRLEAETSARSTKLKASEDENVAFRQQQERVADDFRHRLLAKEEEIMRLHAVIDGLKRDKGDTAVQDAERSATMLAMKREIDRLTSERDDARVAMNAISEEVTQLATRLAVKQAELDAERLKTDQMRTELRTQAQQLSDRSERIDALTRACEKLEITRLRLASWGRARVAVMERDVRFRDVFLEWKAQTLETKAIRSRQIEAQAQSRLKHLMHVRKELDNKLGATRTALSSARSWFQGQQLDFRTWKEIVRDQFSTHILARLQHVQAETIRRCDENAVSLNQALQEQHDKRIMEITQIKENAQSTKSTYKRRVTALVARIESLKLQQLRSLAFQGWKDVYLRNVVAETTHAVMVARTARSMAFETPRGLQHDDGVLSQGKQKTGSSPAKRCRPSMASIREPFLTIDHSTRDAEEEQWRRWRRVTPVDAAVLSSAAQSRRSSITS